MYPGHHASTSPDKPACIMASTGEVVTYRQLDDRSNQLAQLWWATGLRPGDHVAVWMENNARYLEVYWAAIRSGLYLTPISRQLTAAEAAYLLEDSGSRSLVTSTALADRAVELVDLVPGCAQRLMVDSGAGNDGAGIPACFEPYEAAIAQHPAEALAEQPLGDVLFYSSGTTGRPKGIWRPLSGRSVETHPWGRMYGTLFGVDPDSVYLSTGPLYHGSALGFGAAMQSVGATTVILEKFEPKAALDAIEQHKVTHSQWVPTMFSRMLRLPADQRDGRDLSAHRMAIHGAAPCPTQVKEDMLGWWGPILVEYYGGTEQSGMTMIDSPGWLAHRGSVGTPVYGRIRICAEDGAELPAGQTGLIYFERKELPFRYHNDERKTDKARHPEHPNWTTFGDIGYVDADGFLYLTDRKDFMIISGGVNIYPAESENVLSGHPLVADVGVIGVPNEDFGEEVKAVVELVDGTAPSDDLAAELVAFCRDRLTHYKCPRTVEFVDALPRSATGKLSKQALRDRYLQLVAAGTTTAAAAASTTTTSAPEAS